MSSYWESRTIELENLLQGKTNATIVEVNKLYADANRIFGDKINKIFSRYQKNGEISSEYALQLLTQKQTAEQREELLNLLSETSDKTARKKIIAILDAPAYAARIRRIQALSDYITAQAIKIGAEEQKLVKTRLEDVAKIAYYRTIYNDQKNEGKVYDFEKLSSKRLKATLAHNWSGKHYSERIWNNNDAFVHKLEKAIELGCMTGMSLSEMEDMILEDCIGSDSDSGQRFCASRLIRTEVNYFANQGMMMGYREAGIERYQFVATLDLHTSEICRSLDLKTFSVSEAKAGVNCPPLHPFCRSVTVPDTGKRTGTRWARDPVTGKGVKIPANMTYSQWYEKYVKNNQQAIDNEKKQKNSNSDVEQYKRYKKILGTNAPQTLEDFLNIKYNDSDEWEKLKYQYRTVNRYDVDGDVPVQTILDLDKVAWETKRFGFDVSLYKGRTNSSMRSKFKNFQQKGNSAAMLFDDQIYYSHSSVGRKGTLHYESYKGNYPLVGFNRNRIFKTKKLGDGIPREYDTEAKFLEFVATQKSSTDTFTVTILSEKHICKSCQGVVEQFKIAFPNAKVNIISGKKGYNNDTEGRKTYTRRKGYKG